MCVCVCVSLFLCVRVCVCVGPDYSSALCSWRLLKLRRLFPARVGAVDGAPPLI